MKHSLRDTLQCFFLFTSARKFLFLLVFVCQPVNRVALSYG